jgi:hypothetical protein
VECAQFTVDLRYVESNDGVAAVRGQGGAAFKSALLVDGQVVQLLPRRPLLAPGDNVRAPAKVNLRVRVGSRASPRPRCVRVCRGGRKRVAE